MPCISGSCNLISTICGNTPVTKKIPSGTVPVSVTKINRKANNFEGEREFSDIFYPDRKSDFHVQPTNINYNGENKDAQFILEYDTSITPNADIPGFLHSLRAQFENLRLDSNKALENDRSLNLGKDTSKTRTETEYYESDRSPLNEPYDGDDLKVFEDPKKWHSWQKEIFKKVWNLNGSLKKPNPRHIISVIDPIGNSRKLSFFKWLLVNKGNSIGRIGYGTASQLRSSVINIGKKEVYIIDLARAKSKNDREEDLLSVLKDPKSGFLTSGMYESGKMLIIPPPHIIVSWNYFMNYDLLSADRCEAYTITKKKTPGNYKKLIQKFKIVKLVRCVYLNLC